MRGSREDTKIVQISAPLTNDPNSSDQNGVTPIHLAACKVHREIVKILASLTWYLDNPNAPGKDGTTPIHKVAWNGSTEIVKITIQMLQIRMEMPQFMW